MKENCYTLHEAKNEFRRIARAIRRRSCSKYPRILMNRMQIEKKTATIDCGFREVDSLATARAAMTDFEMYRFLRKYNAAAEIVQTEGGRENDKCVYQIQVNFRTTAFGEER